MRMGEVGWWSHYLWRLFTTKTTDFNWYFNERDLMKMCMPCIIKFPVYFSNGDLNWLIISNVDAFNPHSCYFASCRSQWKLIAADSSARFRFAFVCDARCEIESNLKRFIVTGSTTAKERDSVQFHFSNCPISVTHFTTRNSIHRLIAYVPLVCCFGRYLQALTLEKCK